MVTRLVGGLTPADGADPRTFPAIFNSAVDDIEAVQSGLGAVESTVTALGGTVAVQALITDANSTAIAGLDSAVSSQGSAITVLEGSAVALGSAVSVIEAWDLDDLNDVTIGTAVADGQLLAYSTAVSGWVNVASTAGANAGIGTNLVSATAASFTTSSTSFQTATGYAVTITPTSATSKILVIFTASSIVFNNNSTIEAQIVATSGSSPLNQQSQGYFESALRADPTLAISALHSPGTTSAVTYQVELRRGFGSGDVRLLGGFNSLVAVEVAG
jgi:hypothetical protein